MPSWVKNYKDKDKARRKRNRERKRNYDSTSIYKPSGWSITMDEEVLAHTISDRELSKKIGHSVRAIQVRRWRLKKALEESEDQQCTKTTCCY